MLDKKVARKVLDEATHLGATFCDLYIEKTQKQFIEYKTSKVKDISSGTDFGIGVRLLYGDKVLYGYTNSRNEEDLLKLTRTLAAQKNITSDKTLNFGDFQSSKHSQIPYTPDKEVELAYKISKLHNLDSLCRAQSQHISQVSLMLLQQKKEVAVYNTDGLYATEMRPYTRLISSVATQDGEKQAEGMWNPGSFGGWEFIESLDLKEISEKLVKQSLTILGAQPAPSGQMPVVIDNGFGGVIFHEACGHLLETTSVEKKSSVMWDKKGEMIAHEALSAVDDGTMDHLWGSLSIDDEGMPTQKTQLIKNGKLENFMCDRVGHIKTGHPRTGSGRKQNYKFAPASRMRNTYIEPGKHSLDELLQAMGDGIYAASMGGGSVNPGTGEFNFAVQEGYLVKNGKVCEPIKGATLIGKGEEILKKISMVGNNLDYAAGMCGSVSGSIPTTVGQPAIKVDSILVGGQA